MSVPPPPQKTPVFHPILPQPALVSRAARQVPFVTGSADTYLLPEQFSADNCYLSDLDNLGLSEVLRLVTCAGSPAPPAAG